MRRTSTVEEVPKNLEAEQQVVGSIILNPSLLERLTLRWWHFFDGSPNQVLFDVMQQMHDAGKPIDAYSLSTELRRSNLLEKAGGTAYIFQSAAALLNINHVDYHAKQVREAWARRKVAKGISEIYPECHSRTTDELVADLEAIINLVQSGAQSIAGKEMREVCDEIAQESTTNPPAVVATGLKRLDGVTGGGLKPRQLTILAAQTSVGKSALAIQIAEAAALAGKRVMYCSLEMSAKEIVKERMVPRFLARRSNYDDAMRAIADLPVYWVDNRALTVSNIRGLAQLYAARNGLDLLIIDHTLLLNETGKNPYERATEISRKLMALPDSLNIPVLALSQLNRENSKAKGNDGKMFEPRLDQLRDSGSLEQDAHNVWLLHRETRLDTAGKLIIAKHRNGRLGYIDLEFNLKSQTFTERPAAQAWVP